MRRHTSPILARAADIFPEDVFAEIPALIAFLHDHPVWGVHARRLTELNAHSVDGKKVTDHHALLITGKKPIDMFGEEVVIYDMIVGRMLEAFSARCVRMSVRLLPPARM